MIDSITYRLPSWVICPLFNSDESGIDDNDSQSLNEFVSTLLDEGFSGIPMACEELGFYMSNDLDNMGSDCHSVTFPAL